MTRRHAMAGTSLIEVMVAVGLLAMMMLAVAGSQLAMLRTQRTTIWRERALWLADSRIEGARVVPDADPGLAALAAAGLPAGRLTVDAGSGGVRFAVVGWRDGDRVAPARCDASDMSARPPPCVRMPFVEARIDER
jgi:Tfp pilus assembly protein PilV